MPTVLLIQLGSTLPLVGLIWFVQVVHYPLFGRVGRDAFTTYAEAHVSRTSLVVVPFMLAELASALVLVALRPAGVPLALAWAGLALLGVIWLSTFLLQVPCHRALETGFDDRVHRRLVRTNWFRTIAWSGRGFLVLWMSVSAT